MAANTNDLNVNVSVKLRIYTTETCPKCKQLKSKLKKQGLEFEEVDMQDSQWLAELRVNGIFTVDAPVLEIQTGNSQKFLTSDEMFDGMMVRDSVLFDSLE